MLRFRPDTKPPMWGPPDAIRFAIFANAERIGIDPSLIVEYYPLLERGGYLIRDAIDSGNTSALNSEYSWGSDGVFTGGTSSSGVLKTPEVVDSSMSIVQIIKPTVTYSRAYFGNSSFGFFIGGYPTMKIQLKFSGADFTGNIAHSPSQQIACGVAWGGSGSVGLYVDGVFDKSAAVTTPANPAVVRLMSNATGSCSSYFHTRQYLSADQFAVLQREPYTLLMPVARPLYFDMGGSTNTNGPLAITTDSSLGLGGVRGAKGAVFVSNLSDIEAGGVKQAKGATTFLDSAQFVCAGVLEESDDKIGPAVFVNESAVGIGGIKKIFASFGISHASDFGVGGTSGVLMPELSQASGAAISSSEISGSVYTNKNTGTLYAVATLSSTKPSVAQIQAGQNHLGASAAYATSQDITTYGTQSVLADSLSSYTQYYWHFQHKDAEYLDSTVITSSAIRTLDISIPLTFSDTAPATLLTVQVWSKVPKKADVEGLY